MCGEGTRSQCVVSGHSQCVVSGHGHSHGRGFPDGAHVTVPGGGGGKMHCTPTES